LINLATSWASAAPGARVQPPSVSTALGLKRTSNPLTWLFLEERTHKGSLPTACASVPDSSHHFFLSYRPSHSVILVLIPAVHNGGRVLACVGNIPPHCPSWRPRFLMHCARCSVHPSPSDAQCSAIWLFSYAMSSACEDRAPVMKFLMRFSRSCQHRGWQHSTVSASYEASTVDVYRWLPRQDRLGPPSVAP
jgi:hypothetical protein